MTTTPPLPFTNIIFGDGLLVTDEGGGSIRVDTCGCPEVMASTLSRSVGESDVVGGPPFYFYPNWSGTGLDAAKNTLGATFGDYDSFGLHPNSVIVVGNTPAWYEIQVQWEFFSEPLSDDNYGWVAVQGLVYDGDWDKAAPFRPHADLGFGNAPLVRIKGVLPDDGTYTYYTGQLTATWYLSNSLGWSSVTNLGLLVYMVLPDNVLGSGFLPLPSGGPYARVDVKRLQFGL